MELREAIERTIQDAEMMPCRMREKSLAELLTELTIYLGEDAYGAKEEYIDVVMKATIDEMFVALTRVLSEYEYHLYFATDVSICERCFLEGQQCPYGHDPERGIVNELVDQW